MSYILDALRKAEAERERGAVPAVPGVHAPLPPRLAAAPAVRSSAGAPLRWLLLVAALAVLAAAAWLLWGRDALPRAAPSGTAALATSAPAAGAGSAAAQAAPQAAAQAAAASTAAGAVAAAPTASAPGAAQASSATAAALSSDASAKPAPRAKVADAKPRAPQKSAEAGSDRSPARTAKRAVAPSRVAQDGSASAAAAPAAPSRLPILAQLPAELRRQLPPLTVDGSVYSPLPSARMLIVNGQVFHEGSQLTPELRLEQIRPKAAVLSIHGTRFELPL